MIFQMVNIRKKPFRQPSFLISCLIICFFWPASTNSVQFRLLVIKMKDVPADSANAKDATWDRMVELINVAGIV